MNDGSPQPAWEPLLEWIAAGICLLVFLALLVPAVVIAGPCALLGWAFKRVWGLEMKTPREARRVIL